MQLSQSLQINACVGRAVIPRRQGDVAGASVNKGDNISCVGVENNGSNRGVTHRRQSAACYGSAVDLDGKAVGGVARNGCKKRIGARLVDDDFGAACRLRNAESRRQAAKGNGSTCGNGLRSRAVKLGEARSRGRSRRPARTCIAIYLSTTIIILL